MSGNEFLVYLIAGPLFLLIVSGIISMFHKSERLSFVFTSALLAVMSVAAFYLATLGTSFSFLGILQANSFSGLLFGALAFGLLLVEILSYGRTVYLQEFNMLLSFVAFGVFMVTFAYSLIAILVGLESVILSTAFMILASGKKYLEPAVKLFLLGAIATAIFTFALALLLPWDPSAALTPAVITGSRFVLGLSLVLFAGALSIEAAGFPFNFWVPDVYEGSPGNVTALLAGINKKVGLIAMMQILAVVFIGYTATLGASLPADLLFIIATFTMFFGNLAALVQSNVKRLFAYSSISQAGYILVGLAAAEHIATLQGNTGIQAAIFYIIAHMFMIIGAFAIIFWLESKNINTLNDYSGLSGRNMFVAVSLSILMLSMAGVPPLVGFAGKFLLFSSAVSGGEALLAFIGIINSFISIYYYARVMNQMFLRKEGKAMQIDKNIAIVVCICLAFVIIVGIYPQILLGPATSAASALASYNPFTLG